MIENVIKQKKLSEDGFFYLNNSFLIDEINYFRKIINDHYYESVEYYKSLSLDDFRKIAVPVREKIQKSDEFRNCPPAQLKRREHTTKTKSNFLIYKI